MAVKMAGAGRASGEGRAERPGPQPLSWRMADVAACGPGVVGLLSAAMLAPGQHRVTVLEADPDDAPTGPGRDR